MNQKKACQSDVPCKERDPFLCPETSSTVFLAVACPESPVWGPLIYAFTAVRVSSPPPDPPRGLPVLWEPGHDTSAFSECPGEHDRAF